MPNRRFQRAVHKRPAAEPRRNADKGMAALTFIGREDVSERELFVVDAVRASDAISAPRPPGRYFACLLAWDATAATDPDVVALARHLLSTGCVYVCCWGPKCEWVHDTFDIGRG